MQVDGAPNKFEIYQDFYLEENGIEITYDEALNLFYKMDSAERTDFETYYRDETGYEIVDPRSWTSYENYDEATLKELTKNEKLRKCTLEGYAKSKGIVLDPVWSGYSAEEIISMKNNGVNIPQDIVDIANTILESSAVNFETTDPDSENQNSDEVTEKEPYLELIPKAKKKIEKCEENNNKLDDKVDELLFGHKVENKRIKDKMEKQLKMLDIYEQRVREWRTLQDKVNNGEALSDTEAEQYAKLTGMLQDKNNSEGLELDKKEIGKSLNDINILAFLGEKLAEETIEIGDTLADYTSKANYKMTRKTVSAEVGFLRSIMAMAQGKRLAFEANAVGNNTEEYSSEVSHSVEDIASVMELANFVSTSEMSQNSEQEQAAQTPELETKSSEQAESDTEVENDNEQSEKAQEEGKKPQTTEDEADFIINDDTVKQLISEGEDINSDLFMQIIKSRRDIKDAKSDEKFAKFANFKISRIAKQYKEEEEKREEEINRLNEENSQSKDKIEEITGKSGEEIDEEINNENNDDEDDKGADPKAKKDVQEKKESIKGNNETIENLQNDSQQSVEEFKNKTSKEKNIISRAVPDENKAMEENNEYLEEKIPAAQESLDFTANTGITLNEMGKYRIKVGLKQIASLQFKKGAKNVSKGTRSAIIGRQARKEGTSGLPKIARAMTSEAVTKENDALERLNKVDGLISSITGEETTQTQYDNSKGGSQEGKDSEQTQANAAQTGDTQGQGAAGNAGNSAAGANTQTAPAQTTTAENVQTTENMVETNVEATVNTVTSASDEAGSQVQNAAQSNGKTNQPQTRTLTSSDNKEEETKENEKELTNSVSSSSSASSSSSTSEKGEEDTDGDKEQKDADSAQDEVDDINGSAKDDSKESKDIKKDTEKDKKQLEKEAKQLQKQIKKDEEEIIKMTQESTEAAKKQEEALVEYETLVAENEQLIAEDQSKQQNQAPAQNTQQNNGSANGGGAMLGSASMTVTIGGNQGSGNSDRIANNDARINELSVDFTLQGNIINRNRTKITRLQKTTTTNQKKFDKKIKVIDKKVKEEQKTEKKKQEKLAKQLGAVGIAENIFSITTSTGMILDKIGTGMITSGTAMLSNPWTAAAGAALISSGTPIQTTGTVMQAVGTYGTLACGVTKAAINIANGNLAAGLMSLGQTAISAVTSLTGTTSAVSSTMQAVSAGLNIVSSSAQMVNNVRAVQGKEQSGIASKIATVAGAASALTNTASSLTDMGKSGASAFGKSMKIAGAAGTALTTTSQLMTEFGGNSKAAEIMGMVGGAMSTVSAIGQLADSKFGKASDKNKENKEKQENQKTKESDKTQKTQKTNDSDKAKRDEWRQEVFEKTGLMPSEDPSAPLPDGLQTSRSGSAEAVGLKQADTDRLPDGLQTSRSGSAEAAGLKQADGTTGGGIPGLQKMDGVGISKVDIDLSSAGPQALDIQGIDIPEAKSNNTLADIMNFVGSAAQVATSFIPQSQEQQQQDNKKAVAPGKLSDRAKEIMRKRKIRVASLDAMFRSR